MAGFRSKRPVFFDEEHLPDFEYSNMFFSSNPHQSISRFFKVQDPRSAFASGGGGRVKL